MAIYELNQGVLNVLGDVEALVHVEGRDRVLCVAQFTDGPDHEGLIEFPKFLQE